MSSFGTKTNTNLWTFNDDKSGLQFSQTSDIENAYKDLFKRIFADINLDPSTPAGQIITYLTEQDTATIQGIQDFVNYFFLGGSGQMLDLWAYNQYRITRKSAVKGSVLIDIIGVPATIIPKGFIVSNGEMQFETYAEHTIGESGSIQIHLQQVEVSEKIALQNTIKQIITKIDGVDSVNNPNSSTAGILRESDTQFYKRALQYGSIYKNSSFASILANIANVSGVEKISGYENPSKNEVIHRGITMTPHSICVCVLGGSDADIAKEFSYSKPPGCAMVGDTKVQIRVDGKEITYSFYRPIIKALKFEVSCVIYTNSPSSYQTIIREAIKTYINNLNIGADITQPAISKVCEGVANGFAIDSVKIGLKSGGVSWDAIALNLNEMASVSDSDILVTSKGG